MMQDIIYKKDKRLGYNLNKNESRKWLENKRFDLFYDKILERIKEESSKIILMKILKSLENIVRLLIIRKSKNKMQLIKTNSIDIFINYTIDIDGQEINR